MTDTYNKSEAKHILPGELSDNKLIQQSYSELNGHLQDKLDELIRIDNTKHFFHAAKGNRITHVGGMEIEIATSPTETKIKFESREPFDNSNPEALKKVNANSAILSFDTVTGTGHINLQFFINGHKHVWKAQSQDQSHISFQQQDANSKEIAKILSQIDIDCQILLADPNLVESRNEPPSTSGLVMMTRPQDKAPLN